jgi:hypothetical protein
MNKLYFLSVLLLAFLDGNAQISTFPFTQGFEQSFGTGINAEFLANFTGSEVATTNRIFQDFSRAHSGSASCAVVPTSGFDGEILVRLDLTGRSNAYTTFWAASEVNGTGTRPALVFMSASIDGGLTFSPSVQIGDSTIFANASTAWSQLSVCSSVRHP